MILETHLGIVMANDTDTDKEFGIEVQVDSIIPDEVYPELAKPFFKSNRIQIPKVGQQVEVVVIADEVDSDADFGDLEMGTIDFAEFIYYKNTIFDQEGGKVPPLLKTDYPFRSGWWLDNGTIIYMSNKKNNEEIMIQLKDATTQIQMTPTAVTLKRGGNLLEISNSGIKIGATSAAEAIMLGTTIKAAFTTLCTDWLTNLSTLATFTTNEPGAAAYGTDQGSTVGIFQGTLGSWLSTKHFSDS